MQTDILISNEVDISHESGKNMASKAQNKNYWVRLGVDNERCMLVHTGNQHAKIMLRNGARSLTPRQRYSAVYV